MRPEQRPCADETHGLKMPRQGVPLLNDVLGFFNVTPFILKTELSAIPWPKMLPPTGVPFAWVRRNYIRTLSPLDSVLYHLAD